MLSGERVREAKSFAVEASLPARFTFRSRRTALVPNWDPTRISAETLVLTPELGPRHPWRAAHKNVGMILAFLVPHAIGISDMAQLGPNQNLSRNLGIDSRTRAKASVARVLESI